MMPTTPLVPRPILSRFVEWLLIALHVESQVREDLDMTHDLIRRDGEPGQSADRGRG